MQRTKIELTLSVIHNMISICHSKKEISFGRKPTIKDNRAGIKGLPKRQAPPCKDKVFRCLNIGKSLVIQIQGKGEDIYPGKRNGRCLWLDKGARMPIGGVA